MEQNFTFNNQDVHYKSKKRVDFSEKEEEIFQEGFRPSVACVHRILSFARAYQGIKTKSIGNLSFLMN